MSLKVAVPRGAANTGATQGAALRFGLPRFVREGSMARRRLPMRKAKKVGLLKNPVTICAGPLIHSYQPIKTPTPHRGNRPIYAPNNGP